jgi:hypothetical protein
MKRMMLALGLASALMAWPRQGEVCVTEASHGEVTMTESDGRQVKAHCLSDCEAAPPKGDINAVFERDQVTLIWPVSREETKAAVYEVKEAESST